MIFLRLFQHLLPRALAWTASHASTLRRVLIGLSGLPTDIRTFVDLVLLDAFPATTRELGQWEKQFALSGRGNEIARRGELGTAWSTRGRQSPDYLQRAIHAAGFTTVFVYEWWASGPPYVARDPREYVGVALIGNYQCEASEEWECFDSGPGDPLAPHCDDTLTSEPGYLVNLDLTRRPPPPIPDDPSFWPYFLYLAGANFPDLAPVSASRIAELKEIILRIRPSQQWVVFMIDPISELGGFGSEEFGAGPMGS